MSLLVGVGRGISSGLFHGVGELSRETRQAGQRSWGQNGIPPGNGAGALAPKAESSPGLRPHRPGLGEQFCDCTVAAGIYPPPPPGNMSPVSRFSLP